MYQDSEEKYCSATSRLHRNQATLYLNTTSNHGSDRTHERKEGGCNVISRGKSHACMQYICAMVNKLCF